MGVPEAITLALSVVALAVSAGLIVLVVNRSREFTRRMSEAPTVDIVEGERETTITVRHFNGTTRTFVVPTEPREVDRG